MGAFLESIPGPAWGAIGVVIAALFAGVGALIRDWWAGRREAKVDAGQLALEYAKGLKDDVDRLTSRVESLEHDRNAYRSWSHVLWDHIHDSTTPRTPAPTWPTELPR